MLENENIKVKVKEFSSKFDYSLKETAIILAAGHGKRIKSKTSKMLHKIWEVPTVERVYEACSKGLGKANSIMVVGIKADDVMEVIGKRENSLYAYQEEQNGTGHAVQVALDKIDKEKYVGTVFVLPGDMGLFDSDTIKMFRDSFVKSNVDMMVLTGLYEGDPSENAYGRIIRVKDKDIDGNSAGEDKDKVIEIKEHKDILALSDREDYILEFNGRKYRYSKQELIENKEFNSGVYAFKYKHLIAQTDKLSSDNAQKEIYITDLIDLFNKNGLTVGAVSPEKQYVLTGFNNKSVLRQMDDLARSMVYEKLKDIIEFADPEDFFIDGNVVEDILEMDKKGIPLDIKIGKGVFIGKGVKLNYNIEFKKNAYLAGNVQLGQNIKIWENVHLSCYPNQRLILEDNTEILWGDIIKGNIVIGEGSRIESSVNMTGSDEHPLRIGKNVLIKGTSYLFGSIVEDDVHIEHSVVVNKKIKRVEDKSGNVQSVRYFIPSPEGIDLIQDV